MRIEIVQSIKATTYNTLRRVLTLSLALAIFISHTPAQARFLQEDPVWFDAGDLNVYRYTGNNPVNRTDPSGMTAERAGLNVIALGAAAGLTLHGSQTILISLMVLQGSHYVLQEVAKTVNVEGKGLGCLIGLQLSSIGATILGASVADIGADGCSVVANTPSTEDILPRSIPAPPLPKFGCTCTARADSNMNIVGNTPNFAIATAWAMSCPEAAKKAEAEAKAKLGQQPKHVKKRCSGR